MAKKSLIARQKKREILISRLAKKRKELKKKGDFGKLDKLPKNSCSTRHRRICRHTGRTRGYIRKFGVCGFVFRELASNGQIPGVVKSST